MTREAVLALLLSIQLLLIPAALACASQPDPVWIGGIYDGADGEDGPGSMGAEATVTASRPSRRRIDGTYGYALRDPDRSAEPAHASAVGPGRAPPVH